MNNVVTVYGFWLTWNGSDLFKQPWRVYASRHIYAAGKRDVLTSETSLRDYDEPHTCIGADCV